MERRYFFIYYKLSLSLEQIENNIWNYHNIDPATAYEHSEVLVGF